MQTSTSLTFFTATFIALGGALAEELMICCRHVGTELYRYIVQAYYTFINNKKLYVHCILLSALSGATGPIDLKSYRTQKISVQHGLIR